GGGGSRGRPPTAPVEPEAPEPEEVVDGQPRDDDPVAQEVCDEGRPVTRMPLRRLTQDQYRAVIQDVLGVGASAVALPEDGRAGSVRTNAEKQVTDGTVRRYRDAARLIAAEAVALLEARHGCVLTGSSAAACVEAMIERDGRSLWRRPLSEAQRAELLALYEIGVEGGSAQDGAQLVLEAMLQAPEFLYHVEVQPLAPESSTQTEPMDGYAIASRLSFFLWNTAPDDALLDAAAAGALDAPADILAMAEQMLDDPRARQGIEEFTVAWLGLGKIGRMNKSARKFPDFDEAMREAMLRESVDFVDEVVRSGDARLHTLMTAPFSYVPQELYGVYEILPADTYGAGAPVALPDERRGVLTHPSVLAVHAHSDHTSPVKRGNFVLRNILCIELPTPDFEIPELPDPDPEQTTRERFAAHTEAQACATCHVIIDPIGFGFEKFDALGRFRTMEGDNPVDASGTLKINREGVDGPFDGAAELAERLARSPELYQCTPVQWWRHAMRRPLEFEDTCAVDRLRARFVESGGDVRQLMLDIIASPTFIERPIATTED
ncbi:MAG: DUF1592 domain-containing protein, partial [Myxococcota bacterium]